MLQMSDILHWQRRLLCTPTCPQAAVIQAVQMPALQSHSRQTRGTNVAHLRQQETRHSTHEHEEILQYAGE